MLMWASRGSFYVDWQVQVSKKILFYSNSANSSIFIIFLPSSFIIFIFNFPLVKINKMTIMMKKKKNIDEQIMKMMSFFLGFFN